MLILLLLFNCNKKEKIINSVKLEITNVSVNKENSDFLPNTLISFNFNLINDSQNDIVFIASTNNDTHRKSRLILIDSISQKSLEIDTQDVIVLKSNENSKIIGFLNLNNKENQLFFNNDNSNKVISKNRSLLLNYLNKRLEYCKIYYIQNESDLNLIKNQGYEQLSFIKDSLKASGKLYIEK